MKQITVMGLGYIGLPTAITLAEAGFDVVGFDVNAEVIKTLAMGKLHIVEPGLEEAFKNALKSGRLTFVAELKPSDVFYIAVPTPFKNEQGERKADLAYVKYAGQMIGKVLKEDDLVILESTVPPRTTEMLAEVLSKTSGMAESKFNVVHCPERVIPGNMLYELKNNDRIIGARSQKAAEMAKSIYEKVLQKGHVKLTDDITAEMCKLVENTYRDVNIAFANELSIIAEKLGIDVYELISLANCHPRVNILQPGVGVGGHCIAVDPWFICEQFPEEAKLIYTARCVNDFKPVWTAEMVEKELGDNKKIQIGVLGLAYKPNVDDLRESPSIKLCHELMRREYRVMACEPYSKEKMISGIENRSFEDVLALCDYYIITLAHSQFKENREAIAKKPYFDCVGLMK